MGVAAFSLIAVLGTTRVEAQDASGKGGLFGGFGGGDKTDEPGAYASPSAIPQGPPNDLGVNLPQTLRTFDPIALPEANGSDAPANLLLPALPAYAPQNSASLNPAVRTRRLHIDARLTKDGPEIPSGLVWRLFSPTPGADGKLPLVASLHGGSADFDVPSGMYLLHVGFGRAGITRKIDLAGTPVTEEIVLDAGGLKMSARIADRAIATDRLRFAVYSGPAGNDERQLVIDGVKEGAVLALNAGSYEIVSRYGDDNAEVRGEVKVEAGKLTDVTMQHRAAALTMKLVREKGGEAIADTAWQVMDSDGDVVRESVGAFPSMVLAEGDYLVVAKNRDKTYQRDFTVEAGRDADVELLTTDALQPGSPEEGSGD